MTVPVPKSVDDRLPEIRAPRARTAIITLGVDVLRIAVVSLLEIGCVAACMAFLLSLAIVMPALTQQVGTWLASGQWNAVPTMAILERMGFASHCGEAVTNWFLSCDIGFLILPAAGTFALAIWISGGLERSLSGSTAHRC